MREGRGKNHAPFSDDIPLAGADVIAMFHRNDEDAAVADLAGAGGSHDGADRRLHHVVRHHHLHLHLGQQVHHVLLAAVDRGVTLLPAVAPHLGHRHSRDVELRQRILDVVDFVGSNDRFHQLHCLLPSSMASTSSLSSRCAASDSFVPSLVRWKTSIARSPSVEIRTRSTSQPWREITRLMRCSSPGASCATISSTVYRCECAWSKRTSGSTRRGDGGRKRPLSRRRTSAPTSWRPATTSRRTVSNCSAPPWLIRRYPSASVNWKMSSTSPSWGSVIALPRRMSIPK